MIKTNDANNRPRSFKLIRAHPRSFKLIHSQTLTRMSTITLCYAHLWRRRCEHADILLGALGIGLARRLHQSCVRLCVLPRPTLMEGYWLCSTILFPESVTEVAQTV